MSELAETLTKAEKATRQRFVEQYLVDFDPVNACIRLGFQQLFADKYAKQFMVEPYTMKLLADKTAELGLSSDEEQHRKRVIGGLYRIALNRFASASAQVAAYAQIAKITGIEAPVKTQEVLPKIGKTDLSKLSNEDLDVLEQMLEKANAAS